MYTFICFVLDGAANPPAGVPVVLNLCLSGASQSWDFPWVSDQGAAPAAGRLNVLRSDGNSFDVPLLPDHP